MQTGANAASETTRPHDRSKTILDPETAGPETVEGTQDTSLEQMVRAALELGDIRTSRQLVADAEAAVLPEPAMRIARSAIAMAKARIAVADGDYVAAHAILVMAIERDPKQAQLRTLLSEVMLASGRATDVRPVLQHLGQKATTEQDEEPSGDKPAESAG